MAATGTPTPNIGLRIPLGTDPASVDDINYNSNLIDTKLGAVGNDSVQDQIDDLNSKSITVTNWNCQSNENWSANSWSHIGGGGIPSSAIPSGKTISANLIGIFAVSTESGWTRIVANLRTDAVNDIALSIYSNVAGNTNSIKFKALWL